MPTSTLLRAAGLLAAATAAVATTACTASSGGAVTTSTVVRTSTAPPSTVVPVRPDPFALALTEATPQPPGTPFPDGVSQGSCPYIKAGLNVEPPGANETNFADLEGSRVQRVAVLSTLQPVGCRFYWFNDYHPTGDILPKTYGSPTEAYNAMVVTAESGTEAAGAPAFVPGVDGVSFRTNFNPADNGQDWAFAFAKGPVLVVIRTDQTKSSENARLIAAALVDKF